MKEKSYKFLLKFPDNHQERWTVYATNKKEAKQKAAEQGKVRAKVRSIMKYTKLDYEAQKSLPEITQLTGENQ